LFYINIISHKMEPNSSKKEANVLVTGMGPFRQFRVNSSWEIANTLPTSISLSSDTSTTELQRINIIVHKPAIQTSYHDVRNKVPKFFADNMDKDIDLVLHLGSGYLNHYAIETQSGRDNYDSFVDEDQKTSKDLADLPGGEHLWRDTYHAPDTLKTAVQPVKELLQQTQSLLGKSSQADVRLSDDPGKALCGFIYYAGLVERWRHMEPQYVIFLHVRSIIDDETLQEGKEVVLAVIKAALRMIEKRRLTKEDEVEERSFE
jgi:pyroglutamyl-peptidase